MGEEMLDLAAGRGWPWQRRVGNEGVGNRPKRRSAASGRGTRFDSIPTKSWAASRLKRCRTRLRTTTGRSRGAATSRRERRPCRWGMTTATWVWVSASKTERHRPTSGSGRPSCPCRPTNRAFKAVWASSTARTVRESTVTSTTPRQLWRWPCGMASTTCRTVRPTTMRSWPPRCLWAGRAPHSPSVRTSTTPSTPSASAHWGGTSPCSESLTKERLTFNPTGAQRRFPRR
mmetsp:Transcript_5577/g.15574  ORF Transcript_5577/g.15574 Transcript_5577/m.15574 type:complete len:231 (+) Transcript_5577:974-1666(+)